MRRFFSLSQIGMILCAALFAIGSAQMGHAQKGTIGRASRPLAPKATITISLPSGLCRR
jgi:hypothetical protein